jgi:hypothetical protein
MLTGNQPPFSRRYGATYSTVDGDHPARRITTKLSDGGSYKSETSVHLFSSSERTEVASGGVGLYTVYHQNMNMRTARAVLILQFIIVM